MKNYVNALKAISWPENKEVNRNFWIVIIAIILLVIFFIISDTGISFILNKIYK